MKLNSFINQQKEDLLKLRLMEEEIHSQGKLSRDFIQTLNQLENRQESREEDVIHLLESKYQAFMDYKAVYKKEKTPFKDDIAFILQVPGGLVFVGAHGKITLRRQGEEGAEDSEITGFSSNILALGKVDRKTFLLAGQGGILKTLTIRGDKGSFKDISYEPGEDIHFIKRTKKGFLLAGKNGMRGLYALEKEGALEKISDWTLEDQTWIYQDFLGEVLFSLAGDGRLCLNNKDVESFGEKVHGVLEQEEGYLIYGDRGKISWFSKEKRSFSRDYQGISAPIYQVLPLEEEMVLAFESNGKAHLLDLRTGRVNHDLESFPSYISSACQTGEKTYLLGGWSGFLMELKLSKPESFKEYMHRYKESIGWA